MAGGVSEKVKRLIRGCIDSIEQVEVLLFLRAGASRAWSAEEIADALYIQPASANNRLRSLYDSGLIEAETGKQGCWQYQPRTDDLASAVDQLAEDYKVRRVAIINLILEQPLDHIRTFSDAFRLRRDD